MKEENAYDPERDAFARDELRDTDFYEFAPSGEAVFDTHGTALAVNAALAGILGLERSRIEGRSFFEFIEPRDHDVFRAHLRDLHDPGPRPACEIGIRGVGDTVLVRLRSVPAGPDDPLRAWCRTLLIDVTGLREIERELLRDGAEHRSLAENSPDVIFRIDHEGRCLYANPAAERIIGIPRDRIIGRTHRELSASGKDARIWDQRRIRVFRGEDAFFEYEWKADPADPRYFQCRMTPESGPGGVETMLVVARDITERKRMEESLRRSRDELIVRARECSVELGEVSEALRREREMLRTIIDRIPVMLAVCFPGGDDCLVNREFERITGWTGEAPETGDVLKRFRPDDECRRGFCTDVRDGVSGWRETTMTVRNGGSVESSWASVPLSDGSRIHIGIDTTIRKAVEEELRRKEALLSAVLDTLPVGVYVVDRTGKIIRANPAGKRIWGEGRANIERFGGYRAWRTATGEVVDGVDWVAGRAIREGVETIGEELVIECFDGTRKTVMNSVIPLRGAEGDVIGAIVVNEDITARKRVESDLARHRERLEDIVTERTAELVEANTRLSEANRQLEEANDRLSEANRRLEETNRLLEEEATERHEAEEARRRSEERFHLLFSNIGNIAVQGYRPDGTVNYWNAASEVIYGYTRAEALGKNLVDLIIPPEMKEEVAGAVRLMAETGIPIPAAELMLLRKDGTRAPVYSSHAVVKSPGYEPDLFCVDIDISGLKAAENALRESEDRFRALFEEAPIPYYALDGGGRLVEVNQTWLEALGYEYDEVIGWKFEDFLAPEIREWFRVHFSRIRRKEGVWNGQLSLRRRNGTIIVARVTVKRRFSPGGALLRSHCIFQDITEQHRLEENVVRLRREQEGLLAHEVKNLLIPLHVYVENLLFSAETLDPEQRAFLEKIRARTDRAFEFATYFTRLYDLEEGTFTLKRTPGCLGEVLRKVVEEVRLSSERSGVTILLDGDRRKTEMAMDVLLMPGVFFNLILNAAEHVAPCADPAERTVRVSLSRHGNAIVVRINNRGELLPPERLRTFFDKFNADTRKKHGLGLGTTYAYLVVRAHGGNISVASSPEEGTTVEVRFPLGKGLAP